MKVVEIFFNTAIPNGLFDTVSAALLHVKLNKVIIIFRLVALYSILIGTYGLYYLRQQMGVK